MGKETEECTTEAVGQCMSVNDDDAEKNLGLRLLFKMSKKAQKTLTVLSSLKLISLLNRERFVIFQDTFDDNMTEIMDHKNNTKDSKRKKRALTFSKKR